MPREKKFFTLAEGLTTVQRYAVLGNGQKFQQHKHAWKVWRALKQFGCMVYPLAKDIDRLNGSKIYSNLLYLKDKVDVLVLCVVPTDYLALLDEARAAGITHLWFQEQTWTPEVEEQCQNKGIIPVRGCVLRHKVYRKPLCFLNPCYWHGLRDPKVIASKWRR